MLPPLQFLNSNISPSVRWSRQPVKAWILMQFLLIFLQNRSLLSSLTRGAHMSPHTDTHIIIPLTWPPTHTPVHPHTLLLKKGCSMSMLMCWQWFPLQREAVLLNPNSPGTERILSSALTAVVLQHCYFLLSSHSSCSSFVLSLANFIYIFIHFSKCARKTWRRGCTSTFWRTFYSALIMFWLALILKTLIYQ